MTRPTSDDDRRRARSRSKALAVLATLHSEQYESLYRAFLSFERQREQQRAAS